MDVTAIDEGLATLQARARLATIGLYIFILFTLVRAAMEAAGFTGAIDLKALPSQAYVDAFRSVIYGSLAVFYAVALAVAFWIFRAHKNLFDAGYEGLEFTPGWSIGWFFVPIASLYMPYKAMREAWQVSLGDGSDLSDPAPWQLIVWWASYLAGNICDLIAALNPTPAADLLSRIAMISAAWFLGDIIRRITAGQQVTLQFAQTFA